MGKGLHGLDDLPQHGVLDPDGCRSINLRSDQRRTKGNPLRGPGHPGCFVLVRSGLGAYHGSMEIFQCAAQ